MDNYHHGNDCRILTFLSPKRKIAASAKGDLSSLYSNYFQDGEDKTGFGHAFSLGTIVAVGVVEE